MDRLEYWNEMAVYHNILTRKKRTSGFQENKIEIPYNNEFLSATYVQKRYK